MKRMMFLIILVVLTQRGIFAADVAPTTAPAPINRMNFRERYGVLYEHDIFLRDRRRAPTRVATSRPMFETPEQAFVLTGIVFEDGEYHAYLEDLARGQSLKLRIGDSIARGQIEDILIDAIQYGWQGGEAWVGIGNNLTGGEVGSVSDARLRAAASGASTQSTTMPVDIGNLSAEERMKLRRMQELSH
jgi:hypothetical protein